jgi:signal transduction histidine kinase
MTPSRGIALRSQILLIVLGTAIIPLGIVGLWLTRSAMRSGEDLLHSQLNSSADRFAAAAASRWTYRKADIGLIAGNDASVRAVTGPTISEGDRNYLDKLAADLARTIPGIELRDREGRVRWSSMPQALQGPSREPATTRATGPSVHMETPITDASGLTVGNAVTEIVLSAVVPPDSARSFLPGTRVAMRSSSTGVVFVPFDTRFAFPTAAHLVFGDEAWLAVNRRMLDPPIDFIIAAPLMSYVAPFRRAATIGVISLLGVAALSILFATALSSRATRPLEQLAAASDAVTGGNLDRRVDVGGPAEVRRVGAAFNVMTENLRATLDALSRRSAMAALGEFATSLSHDVRNALTSVRVDLDRLTLRDLNDPVASTLVTRVLNNVSRVETAVTGALRIARRGRIPLQDVDLRQPIRAAADIVRATVIALPADLELRLPPEPIRIHGDEAALQQLFANLLFNAAQAMSAGGIARVVAESNDDEAVVTVADTGDGISRANLAKLETPFFSTKVNGTGFGLPIARQVVAAHGGSLTIESGEGQGTTVRVKLPLGTKRSPQVNASSPNAMMLR